MSAARINLGLFRTRTPRRCCAGLALLGYLLATPGLPLPVFDGKDRSRPYPCMDHACGCRSAEQCWRHCCCFSPEEKLVWAQAHGIEPPPYAEQPTTPPPTRWEGHGCATCLSQHDAHEPAGAEGLPRAGKCCHDSPDRPAESDPSRPGWVLSVAALGCQGLHAGLAGFEPVSPPPPLLTWTPAWPPAGRVFDTAHTLPAPAPTPPDPPPRFWAA